GRSVRLLWLLLAGNDWASTRHPDRPPLGTHHGWLSTTERAIRGDAPRHDRGLRDGEWRTGNAVSGGIRVVWQCSIKGPDPAICHAVPGAARIRRPSRSSADHLSSSLLCGFGG